MPRSEQTQFREATMKEAYQLIATPESDARLKDEYETMGAKAYNAGEPCVPPGDPNSMVAGWWVGGWNMAADQHS